MALNYEAVGFNWETESNCSGSSSTSSYFSIASCSASYLSSIYSIFSFYAYSFALIFAFNLLGANEALLRTTDFYKLFPVYDFNYDLGPCSGISSLNLWIAALLNTLFLSWFDS